MSVLLALLLRIWPQTASTPIKAVPTKPPQPKGEAAAT